MAVDVTALAELVSGNIYRGMQSRAQRRQQEEQERANREAEMARETQLRQANARMAQDQIESMNRQEYQRASLDLSRAAGARAEREMGLRTEESARREQERRDELAFLKADTIDLLNQAGELTPDREGRIWATDSVGALNEMRSRFEKAYSEGRSAAKEIENLRKTGKDLKDAGLLKQLVKPDGTPDTDKQALFSAWLDDPTVDRISMIRQAGGQARSLREQAAAEQAARAAFIASGMDPAEADARIAGDAAGVTYARERGGTPPDVAEPLRKRVNDLDSQITTLETALKGKVDPFTGEPTRDQRGGWFNFQEDEYPQVKAMAAQLAALKQERAATYQTLNQATAKQPGVPGGQAAVTGQRPVTPQAMGAAPVQPVQIGEYVYQDRGSVIAQIRQWRRLGWTDQQIEAALQNPDSVSEQTQGPPR